MIRLVDLRKEKHLSQREIAPMLNVSQGTYSNWENGVTQPAIEQLVEIAKFFEVSVDYLVGNSDEIGIINVEKPISQEDLQILKIINALQPQSRNLLINFLNSLEKHYK